MLTKQQTAYFTTFGFLVFKKLYKPEEIRKISDESDSILDEDRGGKPFDGKARQAVMRFVERRPFLSTLLTDDRIYEGVKDLLGENFFWIGGDGNLYVGDTQWHSDTSGNDNELDFDKIKVALYLDPVGKNTGCLRVFPGSHRAPLHQQLEPLRHLRLAQRDVGGGGQTKTKGEQKADGVVSDFDDTPFGVENQHLPGFPIESEPGDVVFFNHRLFHSSFGGKTGRRMFTLNYCQRPKTERHRAMIRQNYQNRSRYEVSEDPRYSDWILKSDNQRIKKMMAIPKEFGFK